VVPACTRRFVLQAAASAAVLGTGPAWARPAASYEDPAALYGALREQPVTTLNVATRRIDVVFADGAPGLDRARILGWIERAATATSTYFGRYPVDHHGILVVAENSDRIGHATTYGHAGSATRIHVGSLANEAAFDHDWVLVHEMVHTALPNLPRRALWLQEGNATWVEPIARAQARLIPAGQVWLEAVNGLPKGRPGPADGGMDGTMAWNRLYWGGAAFWLMAEIAIFEQSMGRFLLRDALRAINRSSGGNTARWSPEELMANGDAGTRTGALAALYQRFIAGPVTLDLADLRSRLGLAETSAGPTDDNAPLSALRRRITEA